MLLTKDTQLMAHALAAAWAREAFVQPFPPPRMVLVGGMRAGLYRLERAAAGWELLSMTEAAALAHPVHAELRGLEVRGRLEH